ncbi:MAG TPA: DUF1579 family protein [Verrucomicrobiales bacterium]|jgi:hypothetical protein|nr:DUF1579 family protein [Verrucomicrobiales bacterium]
MNAFDKLSACAGAWAGTSTLQDPFSGQALNSASTLTVTPILLGGFLRVSYTWEYQGEPQEGEMILSLPKSGVLHAHWIDTWHMSEYGLICTGTAGDDELSLLGHYPAPPGPDWGWQTLIRPSDGKLELAMFNIQPGEKPELAVEAVYGPAAE